uniref:MMGP8 n=1 Tax=uncultured organism TaxID=155900 RepID=G9HQ36_9ZZZZ|nr:MMGP8 [uncultured organism]
MGRQSMVLHINSTLTNLMRLRGYFRSDSFLSRISHKRRGQ